MGSGKSLSLILAGALMVAGVSACDLPGLVAKPCDWSTGDLAAQVLVVPIDSSSVAAAAPAVVAGAGGVILFGAKAPQDLGSQLAKLVGQAPGGRPPFIMADEEGGAVQRLTNLVGKVKSAREMSDTLSAKEIKQEGNTLGMRLKELGVTMDLAPVLDLDSQAVTPGKANAVGTRSFGGDPAKTSQNGVAFAEGLQKAGVIPVVKHFPGLGGSVGGNTDFSAAQTVPWPQLQQEGLVPFKEAIKAGLPAVMTANATVPGLTDKPASISPEVVQVLRNDLGFKGMIVTDTLTAGAFSSFKYTPEKAAVAALQAGASLLLYGSGNKAPMDQFNSMIAAITAAVDAGELSRDTLVKATNVVLKAKKQKTCGS